MEIRVKLRSGVAACLVALQVGFPCFIWAQALQGGAGAAGGTGAQTPGVANAAGFVSSASDGVLIRRGNGPFVPVAVGDLFGPGTTFSTGADGAAVLLFADGQNVTLGNDSVLRIDDFRFDSRNAKVSRATLGLMSGMMRFVTGAIHTGNPEGLVLSAGNAAVDILSKDTTAFVVEVDPKSLDVGAAAAIIGEISIDTPTGALVRVGPDQYTRWQNGVAPSSPAPLAAAPAVFQAVVAASRATVVPSNLPVDIQSAALQAALGTLPAPGAGSQPELQAQAEAPASVILPPVTPGGGGGCVGSPC
jgi:hypothetical protein